MKIGILADIHGNWEALSAVLEHASAEGVDRFVCLGDVVGYNANPHECVEKIRSLDCLSIVKGNHDYYAANDEFMLGFNPQAFLAVKWTRENLTAEDRKWLEDLPMTGDVLLSEPPVHFSLVHGTLDNPPDWGYVLNDFYAGESMKQQWTQLCFFGHTHVPAVYEQTMTELRGAFQEKIQLEDGCKYLVNVGSVGQPRDRDPRAAYGIYDVEQNLIVLHRVKYDIATAQEKIRAACLPGRCADRLEFGV